VPHDYYHAIDAGYSTRVGRAAKRGFFVLIVVQSVSSQGECNMPSTVNVYLIGVWFCVGFFTGAGWAVAAWLVGRVLAII
jgi:hypothetical protein